MKIYQVKCFGETYKSGNEVIVVEGANILNVQNRLAYAKTKNTTCVFMNSISETQVMLDYYYPHKQSPLCLHATMGASYIWFKNNPDAKSLIVVTSITQQKISVEKIQEKIFLTIPEESVDQSKIVIDSTLINDLLNVDKLQTMEYYIASCGSPKLFIEIPSKEELYSLAPNLDLINNWSSAHQINGIYVYCKISEYTYCGRNFNHLNPRLEDVATGIAAATITYHFKKSLIIYQGKNVGNKCVMVTEFDNNSVNVTGNVAIVSASELKEGFLHN